MIVLKAVLAVAATLYTLGVVLFLAFIVIGLLDHVTRGKLLGRSWWDVYLDEEERRHRW